MTAPSSREAATGTTPSERLAFDWSIVIPCVWLALVIRAYLALAAVPYGAPTAAQVPAVEAADRAVVPLLALVTLTAIIRYFRRRRGPERAPAEERPADAVGAQDRP
jgi:hypothetical protein